MGRPVVAAAALANGASVVISSSSQPRAESAVAELKAAGDSVPGSTFDVKDAQALKDFLITQGKFDHLHIHKNGLISPGGSITKMIGTVFNRPIAGWGLVSGVASATKSATRGLAVDLKPIRVNTISPGIANTEFRNVTPKDAKDGIFSHAEKNLLVGHVGTAAEVAEAYIFATKCSYLTGQIITVDGGGSLI
ncbi:hypothetical protein FRC07_007557 [Ceratobasidium sp. 392]|nr:hypothetical protein FRC07_007557 [Ceratobasidium sp. 392]